MISLFSACTHSVDSTAPTAFITSSNSASSIRGNRNGSVSKSDTLNPTTPPSARASASRQPPPGARVPSRATSTTASSATFSRFALSRSTWFTGPSASKGISTIVVTPPAAAAEVAARSPSPACEYECTWASTAPGRTKASLTSIRRAAGLSAPPRFRLR